jgi:hypothetical protein
MKLIFILNFLVYLVLQSGPLFSQGALEIDQDALDSKRLKGTNLDSGKANIKQTDAGKQVGTGALEVPQEERCFKGKKELKAGDKKKCKKMGGTWKAK